MYMEDEATVGAGSEPHQDAEQPSYLTPDWVPGEELGLMQAMLIDIGKHLKDVPPYKAVEWLNPLKKCITIAWNEAKDSNHPYLRSEKKKPK